MNLESIRHYLPCPPRRVACKLFCWPPVWTAGRESRRILFSHPWADRLAWSRRPRFLRPGAKRRPNLFAGPWVGEFGWELMNWQAYVRALRPHYKRVIVCSRAASAALYQGVCDEFMAHAIRGRANSHVLCDIENPDALRHILGALPSDCDHLAPLRYIPCRAQSFVRFGNAAACAAAPDVLIHARGRRASPGRNWPPDHWRRLVGKLQADGYRVGSIGLSRYTLEIENTLDCRDRPLAETMNLIAAAKIVVGPSSGPMHLASLCGTPHLVWTDCRTYNMRKTSRELYESWWNPLNTPVRVLDAHDFQPPVRCVFDLVQRMLRTSRAPGDAAAGTEPFFCKESNPAHPVYP